MGLIAQLREPTRQQYFAYFAAWSGWVLDAFDFTIFLLVMPQVAKEYHVAHVATAGSIALTLLARLGGGWLAGAAADRWGRKLPLLISVIWFALCDGAVAFAPSFTAILVLRTLFGIGMGAEWTTGTTLAMESMPPKCRGLASGVLQGSWAVGYILAAVISAWVLPHYGWRAMFIIAAFPALLALPMRYWVPESEEHAAKVAHEKYAFPLRRAFREDPALLRRVIWGSAVMATGFGAYYGLTGLYPTMLRVELGMGDGSVAWLVALFNVGMLVGSIVVGSLASRLGATISIGVPAALSIIAIPVYTGLLPGSLALGAILGGAIGCGFCGATPLVLTSLFPTEVRARLVGLVYHIGAFFAAFVPMSVAALSKSTGMKISTSLTLVAVTCEAGVVLLVAGPAIAARLSRGTIRRGAAAVGITLFSLALVIATSGASTGCLTSSITVVAGNDGGTATSTSGSTPGGGKLADAGNYKPPVLVQGADPADNALSADVITYRDLDSHPGCTTDGLDARAAGCAAGVDHYSGDSIAKIPGYKCAAKSYPMQGDDDPKKPIVLLVHGNSDSPSGYERYQATGTPPTGVTWKDTPQLSDSLVAAGYRVFAVDFRFDKVDDPGPNDGQANQVNSAQNFDHAWAVPIAQHFFESIFAAYPDRQFSIVGHSLGPTIIRDALRRMHRAHEKPFERIKDLVFGAGANHGVSTFRALCGVNPTMQGVVTCELGDRTSYQPTKFHGPINGPDGAFETPCVDGDTAFGQAGVCGGHKVRYTTVTMKDKDDGSYQDEFVSEASAHLNGASNNTVPLTEADPTGYFCNGLLRQHFGAVRSGGALNTLMSALTAP